MNYIYSSELGRFRTHIQPRPHKDFEDFWTGNHYFRVTAGCGLKSTAGRLKVLIVLRVRSRVTVLHTEHIKEHGGPLSSFVLYPCTTPRNNKPSSEGVPQMGNRYRL